MEWIERRDGYFLVADNGKILGRVTDSLTSSIYHAEVVYAGGGSHKTSLGDYISREAARLAVEAHAKEAGLPGASPPSRAE